MTFARPTINSADLCITCSPEEGKSQHQIDQRPENKNDADSVNIKRDHVGLSYNLGPIFHLTIAERQ